jgi:hypothetical protein
MPVVKRVFCLIPSLEVKVKELGQARVTLLTVKSGAKSSAAGRDLNQ